MGHIHKLALIIIGMCLCLAFKAHASENRPLSVDEEFNSGRLNWDVWCPCQINSKKAPITFAINPDNPKGRFAQIVVTKSLLGGNNCEAGKPKFECKSPHALAMANMSITNANELLLPGNEMDSFFEQNETLGPSLVRPKANRSLKTFEFIDPCPSFERETKKSPYCTPEILRRARAEGEEGRCIQRQELRFQAKFKHSAQMPTEYSFRFRMPEKIENRSHSIRWVLAQWKHEISNSYCNEFDCDSWGPSPFLAQRFDDGVLHVTVQDEHCRCNVASAPLPDSSELCWRDGVPKYCISTKPGDPAGTPCTPTDLSVKYDRNPRLTAPLGRWVEMKYIVQADRKKGATIKVYQDNRPIVTVTGKIGYKQKEKGVSKVKFKIGQYRDYIPYKHTMDIDWVRVRPALPGRQYLTGHGLE